MMVPREMAKRTHHEKVYSNLLPSCQDSAVFRFPFFWQRGERLSQPMHTKFKPEWHDELMELDAEPEERYCLIAAMIYISPCGWINRSPTKIRMITGQDISILEGMLHKIGGVLHHEKGWWMIDYVSEQIGTGKKLANDSMGQSAVKDLFSRPAEIHPHFLTRYPELRESYHYFKEHGKFQPRPKKQKPKEQKLEELPDKEW